MKNDIIPPKLPRPVSQPKQSAPSLAPAPIPAPLEPSSPNPAQETESTAQPATPRSPRKTQNRIVLGIIALFCLIILGAGAWYGLALLPVDKGDTSRERMNVRPGSSLITISEQLEKEGLIRSRLAFMLYARITGAGTKLQAGTYSLSPSESAISILSHFTSGNVDQITITFLPGATLRRLPGDTSEHRTDIESTLQNAGYGIEEIETAFAKDYDHPLFKGKPDGTDLEGYVYGETYKYNSNASVEQILEQTFDEYYKAIEKYDMIQGFKNQGLTLYQGITLSSIVQREVTAPADQRQVAQVFLTRLSRDMSLGSDVTYQYAAKKAGVTPTPTLDSPYNTRKVTGLPPGPISMPGLSALQAVSAPAPGDYLFFLSGDDGVTYFSRTVAEHEANVRDHCKEKCAIP